MGSNAFYVIRDRTPVNRNKANESQIRRLVGNWAQAARKEDMNGVLSQHANDIVMFDVPPPLQSKDIAAYKKTWELFFSWSQGSGVFDLSELKIAASDTVAFCHAIGTCAGRAKNGKTVKLKFRLTIGFRKIRGKWVIAHEHHSLPSE
jgi:ketosteroid isomerase-like protein